MVYNLLEAVVALVAGTLSGRSSGDSPRVWRVGLHDGRLEEVGEGLFGVYGPARP